MSEKRVEALMEQHNKELKTINEGIGSLLEKVPIIERKIDRIEERTDRIEGNVEIIKSSLRRKVDIEEFQALESRVISLEKKLKV